MKRYIGLLCLLLAPAAWATTTVTGKIQTLGTGNVTSGAFVRFWLRGCAGNQPRVNGTSVIGPTQGGVFFFDIAADASGNTSGTVYSTRDNAGTGNGDIECGGSKTAVWYGMQIFVAGKGGPEMPVHAKSGVTLDITQVTPITTNPVIVSPTGDSTYFRLDAGNSPITGNTSFTGSLTQVGTWTFVPAGTSLSAAIAAAPTGTGLFIACGTYSISSALTITNPIAIMGQAPSANFNIAGVQFGAYTPCAKILWTGAASTPMMDITNIIGVDIRNLTFDGNNLASIGLRTKGVNHSKFDGLTFTNFSVAGAANDAAWSSEGGDSGKTNFQWNYVSNIAFNGVVKGFHAWTANINTDTATSIFDGMWCTLIGGASNYCFLLDSADNNDWRNLYGALQSGASGSFITMNDASGPNNGARSNYFTHPSGNPSMTFVSNVATGTGFNFVEGYDKSNGMPNVTGTHPESLVILGSTDLTKMLTLPNQGRINSWNAAGSSIIDMMRLDGSNNLILHSGAAVQVWNTAENAITQQWNDTNITFSLPFFPQITTVGALPNVATFSGAVMVVSDSTAIAAEGQVCVGGGAVRAQAFSNGVNWKCF